MAEFFRRHSQPTSAHYTVDPGETIQSVADHVVAYHCGHNNGSIAFELCDPQAGPGSRWRDANHVAMLDRAAHDVAVTCLAYEIEPTRPSIDELRARGPHGIYSHDDSRRAFGSTSHVDPGPEFPWESFLVAVRRYMGESSNPARPTQEVPGMTPSLKFRGELIAACQRAKANIPASRRAVHAVRATVLRLAGTIK